MFYKQVCNEKIWKCEVKSKIYLDNWDFIQYITCYNNKGGMLLSSIFCNAGYILISYLKNVS